MDVFSDHLLPSLQDWLNVTDIMTKGVYRISPDESLAEAAKVMAENNISGVIVIENNRLVGMLTETDFLRKVVDKNRNFETIMVREIMTSPVITIHSNLSVIEASRIMAEKKIKRLPIITDNRLIGILTQTDMTRSLASNNIVEDVVQIMSQEVATIHLGVTVVEAVDVMVSKNITSIVIMEGEKVVGIFTERDLCRKIIAPRNNPCNLKIEEVMSRPVMSIPYHFSLSDANKIMAKMHIRRLVVMKENTLCGILTQTDIFRALKNKLEEEEKKNALLLENSAKSLFTLNAGGGITYVNPAFVKLFEAPDTTVFINQPFLPEEFWARPEDRAGVLTKLLTGSCDIKDLALKTCKGNMIHVALLSNVIKNMHGQIRGTQGIFTARIAHENNADQIGVAAPCAGK